MTGERRIVFGCCFCGQECDGSISVVLVQAVDRDDEFAQTWWCHFGCFEAALHVDVRDTIEADGT
jgi:hypothetical protein